MSRVIADGLSKKASRQYAELSGDTPANFTAMPQVGGDPIVESGSNSNGRYVKYSDGTMICSSLNVLPVEDTDTLSGSTGLYYKSGGTEWSFPVAFIDTDIAIFQSQGSAAGQVRVLGYDGSSLATSTVDLYVYISVNAQPYRPQATAMGRWK